MGKKKKISRKTIMDKMIRKENEMKWRINEKMNEWKYGWTNKGMDDKWITWINN